MQGKIAIPFLLLAPFAFSQVSSHPVKRPAASPRPECPLIHGQLDHDLDQPCYIVDGFVVVKADVKVSPGAKLTFRQGAAFFVDENSSFSAIGTAEKPILMEGKEHLSGFWSGIEFAGVSSNNRLSYVHISDAGSGTGMSNGAVRLSRKGVVAIDHSLIRNSKGYGLSAPEYTRLLDFTANRLEQNDDPMSIALDQLGKVDGKTQFVGNKKQRIDVTAGDAEVDAEWPSFSVPVYIERFTLLKANIKIAPGAQFLFAQRAGLTVADQGSLLAQGSQERPILFSSPNTISGAWAGIGIGSRSPNNILDHVQVLCAGSGGSAVHVGLGGPGALRLVNSTISGSLKAGVLIEPSSTTDPSPAQLTAVNQIINNAGEPVVKLQ